MRLRLFFAVATLVLFSTMVCGQQVGRDKKKNRRSATVLPPGLRSLASRAFVRLQPVCPGGCLQSETISSSNGGI